MSTTHAAVVASRHARLSDAPHGLVDWLRRNPKVLAEVKAAISANGPMGGADFEGAPAARAGRVVAVAAVQHGLHYLWMTGALTIHSRRHFHKRYDLLGARHPRRPDAQPVSAEEFTRWHVERSLHAMGAATERDLAGYLTFPASARAADGPRRPRCSSAAR